MIQIHIYTAYIYTCILTDMPVILYIQEMRLKDHKFEASLSNISIPCVERKAKRD